MRLMVVPETSISRPSFPWLTFISLSSSPRISPGCIGGLAIFRSLVVIGYLDVSRTVFIFRPFEADSVLFVDADAELSRSVAAQSFEPITWQGS
jgi:hypothetical protein